ncbi:MAG: CocE/NonD family hydrolase [Euryarchaeota archaeon]|nr:CocE/NonD family hydrolase [Euryarchaeota archaeon]
MLLASPRRLVCLLVVAAVATSGCLSGGASEKDQDRVSKRRAAERVDVSDALSKNAIFSLQEIKPFVATARDGVKLKGHVYLPNATGPVATVLEYSPYFNMQNDPSDGRVQSVNGRRTMTGNHQPLLDAGFAVALINLRGTGISGGCIQWGTKQDQTDLGLVIDTLASLPWSNGNVGMVGTSYPGWTQYLAMAAHPPALKAVVPVSGLIDLHSLLSRNGATLSIGPVVTTQWHALYSMGEMTYAPIDSRGGEANHMECGPRVAEDARESATLYAVGDRNAYWEERDLRDDMRTTDVPILWTNGLTDGEGHILQVEGLWESIPHANKRMILGQWGHGGTAHPSGDWAQMRVAWFDHWLRGGPPLLETGLVEYQDDLREWHTAGTWPPPHNDTTLYLSDRTVVASSGEARASTQTFQSTYSNPCPGLCTSYLVGTPHQPVCGPHQALYVSPPLVEDVLLAGNFHVNLTVTSTLPDGNFAVFLYRTKGAGTCPDVGSTEIRRALTDLRHARAPGHAGADFPVASATTVSLVSHPFASPIKAGERLVVAVGGGAMELTPDPRLPVLTVTTGAGAAGQFTVPVVEGTLRFA